MTSNDDDLASQQFCVRWNCHMGSLGAAFHQLLAGQRFVDVTLACDGHQIHCHRLVLAACSTYFESILGENPCKHPIIILPREVRLWQVQALVDFMYRGEVNVSQSGLQDLLKCAEALQIRGLCGSEAAVNLSNIANLTSMGIASGEMITAQNHSIIANPTVTSSSTITVPKPIPIINNQNLQQSQSTATAPATTTQQSSSLIRLKTTTGQKSINHLGSSATIQNSPSIVVPPNNLDLDDGNSGGSRPSLEITRIDDIDDSDLKMCEEYDDDNSNVKLESELMAMENVTCEYENVNVMDNAPGRRVRRSEALLRQAAECVSRGQTFQTVSDMFHIPISTIRFFMARKGILPRRKRGRTSGAPLIGNEIIHQTFNEQNNHSRSSSPSEPPFHFANYKLPDLQPKLF